MAFSMCNHKAAIFLVLLFIISSVEGRHIYVTEVGSVKNANGKPSCDFVYGAKPADTCEFIIEDFALDSDFFLSINPNINCDDIFVDQWICVEGSA